MKKIYLIAAAICLVPILAFCASSSLSKKSKIGPSAAALSSWGAAEQAATVGAAVSSSRNCLTSMSVSSPVFLTLRVLDGGTTVYAVDIASTTTVPQTFSWSDDDMCGTSNTAMYVRLSTAVAPVATSVAVKLNFSGFTY